MSGFYLESQDYLGCEGVVDKDHLSPIPPAMCISIHIYVNKHFINLYKNQYRYTDAERHMQLYKLTTVFLMSQGWTKVMQVVSW